MVRILSSGEIVADDDERAQQENSADRAREVLNRRSAGGQGHASSAPPGDAGGAYERQPGAEGPYHGETSQISLFDAANNRLLEAGLPRIPIGSLILEPVHSVGILLILLFFGLPGILLVAMIFIIRELSKENSPVARAAARFIGGGNNESRARNQGEQRAHGINTNSHSSAATPDAQKTSVPAPKQTGNNTPVFGGAGHRLGSK